MTFDTLDLQTRVARYEAAVEELRAAHRDVRSVLHDQVLFARWQQMGVELGFVASDDGSQQSPQQPNGSAAPAGTQLPQLAESWAG